jgi:hypothetical protein
MSKARDLANAGTALTTVSATELGYLDGVTSAVQTQIDSKITGSSAIAPTIVDAKGDIIAATAADTVARLAVGSNDQVLTADSSTATGLKWATPVSGSMTLLSTTTLTGSSVTISSINQSYKNLYIIIQNATITSSGYYIQMRFNGITSANYLTVAGTSWGGSGTAFSSSSIGLGSNYTNQSPTSNKYLQAITIPSYSNSTTWKFAESTLMATDATSSTSLSYEMNIGFTNLTTAISSLTFIAAAGTFSSGTVLLYGVN